jgi:hypothetical protein
MRQVHVLKNGIIVYLFLRQDLRKLDSLVIVEAFQVVVVVIVILLAILVYCLLVSLACLACCLLLSLAYCPPPRRGIRILLLPMLFGIRRCWNGHGCVNITIAFIGGGQLLRKFAS